MLRHPIYTSVLTLAAASAAVGLPGALIPAALLATALDRKADRGETRLLETRPES